MSESTPKGSRLGRRTVVRAAAAGAGLALGATYVSPSFTSVSVHETAYASGGKRKHHRKHKGGDDADGGDDQ